MCSPIIKNYAGQECIVVNADNSLDATKKVHLTFTDVEAKFDRLENLATSLVSIQITTISGQPISLSLGQKILFSYTYFTHTDSLRDNDVETFWSTEDGNVDNYIIFDLNPYGANSTIVYNNIELIMRDIPFNVGPYEYILQGASMLANSRQRYKHISSGYIPAKSEGGSYVIKFDEVDYKYIKLILIGSANSDYNVCTSEIRGSIAMAESTPTTTSNINLAIHCSGNIGIDYNTPYDINLHDYSLVNLSDVDYEEGMGLLNLLYHKKYLDENYSGYTYGICSGDYTPLTGVLDFGYNGIYNIGTSGNSVGIDFGATTSGDCLVIRDANIKNSGSILAEDDFRFFYGDVNGTFFEGSGFNVDLYNNGLGTDVCFSNLDFNSRYAKINYIGMSMSGGIPISFGNDIDLALTPTTEYIRVAKPDYSYTDMFSLSSQISGSGSFIGFTEVLFDFVPLLFNRTVNVSSGYVEHNIYGENYDVKNIYYADMSNNLSAEDFYLINAIPYYADEESVNLTVSKGEQIEVLSFSDQNIAKVYIPHNDNSGYPERAEYKLVYYNIRYGTQLAYQGIPAKSDIFSDEDMIGSIRSLSAKGMSLCSTDKAKSIYMTMDIPKTTAVLNSEVLTMKFAEARDYKVYAISIVDTTITTLLTENVDYTINTHTKHVVMASNFETIYSNHYIGIEYEYPIFKINLNKTAPMKFFNMINSVYEEEKIQLSGIKIYPEQYFKNYLVNDIDSVYTFTINPKTESTTSSMNATILKLLDGSFTRDSYSSRSRDNIKVSFPKVEREMLEHILMWSENGEVLGLVDDMLTFREIFIEPNSLTVNRRQTTRLEQINTTGSYNCDFTIQER